MPKKNKPYVLKRMPQVSSNPDENWQNDAIQFPRLIAELEAAGAFTSPVLKSVAASMDLKTGDVVALIDRAQGTWDDIKAQT